MTDDPRLRLNAAIARAAAETLGAEHPLVLAAQAGEEDWRAALEALAPEERDRILAAAHRLMREDVAAVWSFLSGPAPSRAKH